MPFKITCFIYFFFFALFFNLVPGRFLDLNFTGYQIGLIFGIIPITSFFFNILWGEIADKLKVRKQLLIAFSLIASVAMTWVFSSESIYFYYFFAFIIGSMVYPMISLNDSLLISYTLKEKLSYGVFRQWGTVAFICGNLFLIPCYFLLKKFDLSEKYLLYLMPFVLVFMSIAVKFAVDVKSERNGMKISDSLLFFKTKIIKLLLLSVFFHNVAFVSLYSYFTPHMKLLGFSPYLISFCWAISPIFEVFIFRYSKWIFTKFNPVLVFRLAIFIGALRWFFIGFFEDKTVIVCSQLLHSVAFGAYYVSSVYILSKIVPEKLRSTGQGIFSAVISLAMFMGNILFGYIYQNFDSRFIFQAAFIISSIGALCSLLIPKKDI